MSLETNVHNFTANLIKKWISEYSPTKDEYYLKMSLVLRNGKAPMEIPDKTIDEFFVNNVTDVKFLGDPLTVLSFDDNSAASYTKSIHHFIELAENMLKFEEEKAKTNTDFDQLNFKSLLKFTTNEIDNFEGPSKVNIESVLEEILERIRVSLNFSNYSDAYANFMTLQCLYLVIKDDPKFKKLPTSAFRELINCIVLIASLGPNSCLTGFTQFVEYLQTSDRVMEAGFFTDNFFGIETCFSKFSKSFKQSGPNVNNIPAIVRIYNDFTARYTKQRHAQFSIGKEARGLDLEKDKSQFLAPKKQQKLVTSLKIRILDNHEYVASRENAVSSVEL